MFILDSLLIGGLRFVFDKLAAAVDTELNDDTALREQLLAAQMRVELGEMSEEAFSLFEADTFARLRDIRDRRQGSGAATLSPQDYKITGIEATFGGDQHEHQQD
jgi:gas vesicle protein GvpG